LGAKLSSGHGVWIAPRAKMVKANADVASAVILYVKILLLSVTIFVLNRISDFMLKVFEI